MLPKGHLAVFGDTYHNLEGELEPKVAAKHSAVHRIAPITKNYLAQNVNSAKVEKLCPVSWHTEVTPLFYLNYHCN